LAGNGSADYAEVDVEGAKALIAQSGATNLDVTILYASTNPRRVNEFALIQASAALAGFNVIDGGSPEWGGILGTPGAYDATFFGWQSTSLGAAEAGPNFETGGINNHSFFSNADADAAIKKLNKEFDPAKQIELKQEIDKILWDNFYGVTLFQFPGVTAFNDSVTGVEPSILAPTIFWNIWDWQLVS
jgi:peptide/nickel transport system substrate-binding protein